MVGGGLCGDIMGGSVGGTSGLGIDGFVAYYLCLITQDISIILVNNEIKVYMTKIILSLHLLSVNWS